MGRSDLLQVKKFFCYLHVWILRNKYGINCLHTGKSEESCLFHQHACIKSDHWPHLVSFLCVHVKIHKMFRQEHLLNLVDNGLEITQNLWFNFLDLFFPTVQQLQHSDQSTASTDFRQTTINYFTPKYEHYTTPTQSCAQKHNKSLTQWPVRREYFFFTNLPPASASKIVHTQSWSIVFEISALWIDLTVWIHSEKWIKIITRKPMCASKSASNTEKCNQKKMLHEKKESAQKDWD